VLYGFGRLFIDAQIVPRSAAALSTLKLGGRGEMELQCLVSDSRAMMQKVLHIPGIKDGRLFMTGWTTSAVFFRR